MDNIKTIKERIESEDALQDSMIEALKQENRNAFTDEEDQKFVESEQRKSAAQAELRTAERISGRTSKVSEIRAALYAGNGNDYSTQKTVTTRDLNDAIRGIALGNTSANRQEWRNAADRLRIDDNIIRIETRDQTVGTPAEGGYLTSTSLHQTVTQAQKAYEGILDVANVLVSQKGTNHNFPINNNTSNKATVKAELATRTQTDQVIDNVQVPVFNYSTACFPVSYELIEDADFDIGAFVGKNLGEAGGRGLNDHWTTGVGNDRCNGIITGATAGVTTATATTTDSDDLYDLLATLDLKHIESPNFGLMMHWSTLLHYSRQLNDLGVNVLGPGLNGPVPRSIIGHRVFVNNSMPVIGSGNKIVVAGDFSAFWIRLVGDVHIEIKRNPEDQSVEFYWSRRSGSKVVDAGDHPLRLITCAASGSGG